LLLFFLQFTWGRHRRARATTALPGATSLELLILFGIERLSTKRTELLEPKQSPRLKCRINLEST
jgi:hypothetical protein